MLVLVGSLMPLRLPQVFTYALKFKFKADMLDRMADAEGITRSKHGVLNRILETCLMYSDFIRSSTHSRTDLMQLSAFQKDVVFSPFPVKRFFCGFVSFLMSFSVSSCPNGELN